jgi:hypothetical protein
VRPPPKKCASRQVVNLSVCHEVPGRRPQYYNAGTEETESRAEVLATDSATDVQAKIGVRIMPGTDSVEGTLGLLVGLFTYKSSFCSCSACSACLPYSIFLAHISAGYTERQVQRLQVFPLLLINMRLGAELPR